MALARHNLTTAATYRITAGTTVGGTDIYDSTTLPVWPAVYLPEDLEWEDDNWWEGQITAAEAEGYPIALEHDVGGNIRARYWRIAFADPTNPAGYVELARLWMGPLWSPQRNLSYGAGLTWEARSIAEYSLGGVLFSEPRPPAWHTASASATPCEPAIGAWMMGRSRPSACGKVPGRVA